MSDKTSESAPGDAESRSGFATRVIHAGQHPDPSTGAVMPPIYATSTYAQSSPGVHQGFEYSRSQNPTRFAYERCVADLEDGRRGFAFASGLAATATLLELLAPGDHVVASDDMYGGSRRLFTRVRALSAGLGFTFVDMRDVGAVEAAMRAETRLIWVETPSNPMLKLADLAGLAALARRHGVIAAADNTFATPYLQRPLKLGFDLVMHSGTKYLNGHSDVVNGVLIVGERGELAALTDDEHTVDDVGMTVEILGARMHHQIEAQLERALQIGRGKSVIGRGNRSLTARQRREAGQIRQLQHRIAGCLDPDQPGLGSHRGGHGAHITHVHERETQAGGQRAYAGEEAAAAAIHVVRSHHVIARRQ